MIHLLIFLPLILSVSQSIQPVNTHLAPQESLSFSKWFLSYENDREIESPFSPLITSHHQITSKTPKEKPSSINNHDQATMEESTGSSNEPEYAREIRMRDTSHYQGKKKDTFISKERLILIQKYSEKMNESPLLLKEYKLRSRERKNSNSRESSGSNKRKARTSTRLHRTI